MKVEPDMMRKIEEREGKKFARLHGTCKVARQAAEGKTDGWFSVTSEEPCRDVVRIANEWKWAYVVLSHAPGAIDMTRMDKGINLRDGHGGDQVAKLEGCAVRGAKLGGTSINWSVSERAQVLRADYESGVRDDVSVEADYEPEALSVIGEHKGLPLVRVARWVPLAAALAVCTPADPKVGTNRTAEGQSATPPKTESNEPPVQVPAAITRKKTMEKTAEQIAAEQRADVFRMATEVHKIVRDFDVSQDQADKWLTALEKGETDITAIYRETVAKHTRRADIAAKAAVKDEKVQRELQATSGNAPDELAAKFNVRRAILAQLPESELQKIGVKCDVGLERETQQEMLRVIRAVPGFENYAPKGVMVPNNMPMPGFRTRREIQVTGGGAGASLVATNLMAAQWIDILRDRLVLMQAGATSLSGLQGNTTIPRQSAKGNASWLAAEGDTSGNSEMGAELLTLTPHSVSNYQVMSRQSLLQTTPDIQNLVLRDLVEGNARVIQIGALHGTGASGQPTGVKARTDVAVSGGKGSLFTVNTAGSPTFAELLAADSVLGDYNVEDDGSIGWIMQRRLLNTLRAAPRATATISGTPLTTQGFLAAKMGNEETVVDTRAFTTQSVTKNYAFYGRWSDLVIAQWGSFELIVDPYSLSTRGALRITGLQSVDCQTRYDGAFTYCAGVGNA